MAVVGIFCPWNHGTNGRHGLHFLLFPAKPETKMVLALTFVIKSFYGSMPPSSTKV